MKQSAIGAIACQKQLAEICINAAKYTPLGARGKQVRRDTIALSSEHGGYHYGGSFSCVEILLAFYDAALCEGGVAVISQFNQFLMSKGHSCWPFYVLLREHGMNPALEGHPKLDRENGVNFTTGSEGHGLPAAAGMAMARRFKNLAGSVVVLVGDGECQEGTTWETLLIAGHHRLSNLVVVVDCNRIQGSGWVKDILPIDALGVAAQAAGWDVHQVNGHNVLEVRRAMFTSRGLTALPTLILAHTVKGKGISFMEDQPTWHAKWLDPEHTALAQKELAP